MAKLVAKLTLGSQFRQTVRRLGRADKVFLGSNVERAKKTLARMGRDAIVGGIDAQRPEWAKLSPITQTIKGHEQILKHTGSFRGAMKMWKEGDDWYAGLYPASKGKDGQDLEMVGAVHEDGAVVPVTTPIKRWFASMGFPLRADTKFVIIPSRKWFEPAVKEVEQKMDSVLEPLMDDIVKEIA